MRELQLKNKIVQILRKEYPQIWFYKSHDMFTAGIPDLILCVEGKFVAIELKTIKGQTTKLQEYTMDKIRNAGGTAWICRSVKDVRNLLTLILKCV